MLYKILSFGKGVKSSASEKKVHVVQKTTSPRRLPGYGPDQEQLLNKKQSKLKK
jgi:hypothetical protein